MGSSRIIADKRSAAPVSEHHRKRDANPPAFLLSAGSSISFVANQNKSLSQKRRISLIGPSTDHRILPIWDFAPHQPRRGAGLLPPQANGHER
jgi:hypothetical protein